MFNNVKKFSEPFDMNRENEFELFRDDQLQIVILKIIKNEFN